MYHNWSAIEENVLPGVPKVVGWLVWMGLMSAFQLGVKFLKNKYFPFFAGIFAGVNECLLWLDLAILCSKVVKNYGIAKIRVFLGLIFGISLAKSAKESWHSQNLCLSASRNAQILSCG